MKIVSVISTGNELLYGRVRDRNSGFISRQLFNTELSVKYHFITGDVEEDLRTILQFAVTNSDIIIISGGLGPTDDDITIDTLKKIYNFTTMIDNEALVKMKKAFESYGRPVSEDDYKMVEVPSGCHIIRNRHGLAPGFVLDDRDKLIIALPGVPHEMNTMFSEEVKPLLLNKFGINERKSLIIGIAGLKESEINRHIREIDIIRHHTDWGITAENGICTLTFVEKGEGFNKELITGEIHKIFKDNVLSGGFNKPEEELLFLLKKLKLTISVSESCTGGLISKRITDIPGSSESFIGGIVAYSNDIKKIFLGGPDGLIEKHGAVSAEVAEAMSSGIRNYFKTDIGISTTGVAGPGGGSPEKPVGTVFFGFSIKNKNSVIKKILPGDREGIRTRSAFFSIDQLRKELLKQD